MLRKLALVVSRPLALDYWDTRRTISDMLFARRSFVLITTAFFALFGLFFFGLHFSTIRYASREFLSSPSRSRTLHLLVPATSANLNLCRLLLSAAITGYPEPIFIGWGGRGIYNGTESHLFKITETLTYLRSLPPSADDDLVLLVDGYDVWMQLRPDVMISRYSKVLAANEERVRKDGILGKEIEGTQVRNTVVFGPDKIHWPQGRNDPPVWAAPESPLPRYAFGPKTDTDMHTARPRFLNSGTIMGPVKDVREVFLAALDMLSRKYDAEWEFRNSDQFYLAEVWGEQEINRRKLQYGSQYAARPRAINKHIIIPDIPAGKRTEYHICLDYESELFQAATAWERSLAWMRFNDSTPLPKEDKEVWSESAMKTWTLRQDILASEPPFAATEDPDDGSWEEVMLGTNTVSKSPFPLFHVTGNKMVLEWWWPRMWFHPHGERLLKAARRRELNNVRSVQNADKNFTFVDGVQWKGARPIQAQAHVDYVGKGGAWQTSGRWIPWNSMCSAHEPVLYLKEQPVEQG